MKVFFKWLSFKTLDLVWGNGESAWKLLRSVAVLLIATALIHVIAFGEPGKLGEYCTAIWAMPQVLLGVLRPAQYPDGYLAAIFLVRLIAFGFFMSIVIKRFNRR